MLPFGRIKYKGWLITNFPAFLKKQFKATLEIIAKKCGS
jgi:hypothetical protein